ncbi:hypothetical protein [Thalassotalea ganghwensis]
MSITIGNNTSVAQNTETAHGVKTAKLVKNQTELEGQMALELIQSANINGQVPAPTASKGNQINIKV